MDLMLTKNGDIVLEEVFRQSHEVGFIFFIKPKCHPICLKFDISLDRLPQKYQGLIVGFEIRKKEELFDAVVLDEKLALKQMCYNAIRTQKGALKQALTYGSDIYLYTNKCITNETLERMAQLAQEAISFFMPKAHVTASVQYTSNGGCNVCFEINTLAHTLTLDYFI